MKRDMDLVRRILLDVESWPPEGGDRTFSSLGTTQDDVTYNVYQCIEAGLLEGESVETSDGLECFVFRLTPQGHDFLDNARNEFIWDEVREQAKQKGITSTSIDILKRLLNKQLKKHL